MIAEICIRHAKICKTVLHYRTTLQLQNSFKNQRLIPFTIRVKKASGFKSCQASEVQINGEDQSLQLQCRDRLFVDLSGSNDRLNAFFVKQLLDRQLAFPSTLHESTSLIQFTSLKLNQPASSLFFSTRNSKEPTLELQNSTRGSRIENRVSSRVLRLASDCQLTFERCCINFTMSPS